MRRSRRRTAPTRSAAGCRALDEGGHIVNPGIEVPMITTAPIAPAVPPLIREHDLRDVRANVAFNTLWSNAGPPCRQTMTDRSRIAGPSRHQLHSSDFEVEVDVAHPGRASEEPTSVAPSRSRSPGQPLSATKRLRRSRAWEALLLIGYQRQDACRTEEGRRGSRTTEPSSRRTGGTSA